MPRFETDLEARRYRPRVKRDFMSGMRSGVAATPTLTINDVSLAEGNSGTTPFDFTLTRTGDLTGTTVVHLGTKDGTAQAQADYLSDIADTVTFLPGDSTKTFTVTVNGEWLANTTMQKSLVDGAKPEVPS